jgi:hypothetical protein
MSLRFICDSANGIRRTSVDGLSHRPNPRSGASCPGSTVPGVAHRGRIFKRPELRNPAVLEGELVDGAGGCRTAVPLQVVADVDVCVDTVTHARAVARREVRELDLAVGWGEKSPTPSRPWRMGYHGTSVAVVSVPQSTSSVTLLGIISISPRPNAS